MVCNLYRILFIGRDHWNAAGRSRKTQGYYIMLIGGERIDNGGRYGIPLECKRVLSFIGYNEEQYHMQLSKKAE